MNKGNKFHPSRISGKQKFLRALDANKMNEKPKKPSIEPLDLSKNDWMKSRPLK